MDAYTHVWSLMVQKGIDGDVAVEALLELVKFVEGNDAAKLRAAHPSLGDQDTLEKAAQFLEDRGQQEEHLSTEHVVNRVCTCPGCTGCPGRVINCTCDVDWEFVYEESGS